LIAGLHRVGESRCKAISEIKPADLNDISETLLIPLYYRAMETQRPDAMIKDDKAVTMVNQLDCNFSRLRMQKHDEIAIIMRLKKFDEQYVIFKRVTTPLPLLFSKKPGSKM